MRLAIDGNGDQELESLMKRVAGLETAVSTMQTTMYAMREVDRILEGVQLPNQDEAMIRTHYLNMVRVNKLTDPIKIAQYTGQWTHRHRGHCDVTMHVPLGTEMVLTDLTVISVTTDLQEGLHLGICTPTVSWYGYQSSGIQLTNLLSSYYLVDEYYFRDRENPTTSLLLAVIGADQGEPNPPTNDEAEALMVKLGYPAYTGAPGDSEAKEAYMKYARIIAQIRAYTMMAGNGTVDDGVPYWYMIYQPPNAPKNPFDPLLPPNML
jgi:hypothetical protein